ncbi:MAG: tRNA uridine-5-carboxymethylaminomethyl(34) synthesis GTPase MnmE [Candidatus Cloacimonadaceae bacterium]|nr:tRNA uridine-5-carboxymethylaminomethyl(34) synthesis GTPase MnmE [Candidatus Cloacimonadaceae bacterium]
MISLSEPIVALITPAGSSAIAVLRLSGKNSVGIVAQHFRPRKKLLKAPTHRLIHGIFHDSAGLPIDEVLVSVFRAPHSYTGEESVEISCHGNPHLATRILKALLLNARHAKAGEFTLRALMNGKLDLARAEAVNDLIRAGSIQAETAALMQTQGILSRHLKGILDEISEARMRSELAIDFSDQDLPQIDLIDLQTRIDALCAKTRELCAEGNQGRYIRDGIRICLAGAPNSGKSSLFNAFLKHNRAIVTPHPGTTRDYLEESVSLRGYTLVLYDTAGLRESTDEIERHGIDRSLELMQEADLVLYLIPVDAVPVNESTRFDLPDLNAEIAAKCLFVLSKTDLLEAKELEAMLTTAAFTPASSVDVHGLDALADAIIARFDLPRDLINRPLVTNTRHLAALQRCQVSLEQARQALSEDAGFEFVAFDLISASSAIEDILGVITPDDMLERIFGNFCIGK